MTKPILVCMVWRGGDRFARCLRSIVASREHFERIVLSVTADEQSDDMALARQVQEQHPNVEVICTGRELPTMEHQAYWVDYLEATGTGSQEWIYWLAYDDEVKASGIRSIVDEQGDWPLQPGTAYFGPWAMRHEQPDQLWQGDPAQQLESWTSFPQLGPPRLTVAEWIAEQLRQPTYMQMSGSVNQFRSFTALRDLRPRKKGPMRIEMAIAAGPGTSHVEEFAEPVSIIYGRSNSDRASYGRAARREDLHLLWQLSRRAISRPNEVSALVSGVASSAVGAASAATGLRSVAEEEWRRRGVVVP